MNRFLRSGCVRAVETMFRSAYESGKVDWLLMMRKAVRGKDANKIALGLIYFAIDGFRKSSKEPLFNHEIYDSLWMNVLYQFILEAVENDKDGEFMADMVFLAQEWTLMSDIKECRKEHPRRSKRLAAKRAAKA